MTMVSWKVGEDEFEAEGSTAVTRDHYGADADGNRGIPQVDIDVYDIVVSKNGETIGKEGNDALYSIAEEKLTQKAYDNEGR